MKTLSFIVASIYLFLCVYFPAAESGNWHFINSFDLIIHEAGHTIVPTFLLGETMTALGGSMLQIIIPLVFALYFFRKKDLFSFSILLMWVAENVASVSVYVSDALHMQIPLLGGDNVIHDWNFILGQMNLLVHAEFIGNIFYCMSWIIFVYAFFLGISTLHKSKQ